MIRSALPSDLPAILLVAAGISLFDATQLHELEAFLGDYFRESDGKGLWVISGELWLVGVAYAERERMTVGTWNLQWIAIAPEHQRQGHGTTLLGHVERELANSGAHQLLIETSASLTGSQAFYRDCGYQEEGRIRDFYEVGTDKIVFRKVILFNHRLAQIHTDSEDQG